MTARPASTTTSASVGETGAVVGTLIDREDVVVRGVETESPNLAYVHDRSSGERKLVVAFERSRSR